MKCKVGDLVLVTRVTNPKQYKENIGRFGTVVRALTAEELVKFPWAGDWVVMPQHFFKGFCLVERVVSESKHETTFADAQLTPIRPGDLVEDTSTSREKETV